MNTVLSSSKLSAPSKLVRRVLSRTSIVGDNKKTKALKQKPQKGRDTTSLDLELSSLKEQVGILQLTVNRLNENCDKKDKALADLAREKQQLSMELIKEQRCTLNLEEQLNSEREFYFKEKEQYCQEMNECKKLKKKFSENAKSNSGRSSSEETISMRKEVDKLKEALHQTLEVNYNLSVKFLKMRNTKSNLKERLKKQENDHFEEMQNLEQKIGTIKTDMANIIDKRFLLPISPSNKRFLQTIKQNGVLMHENLCLQMDIDRLSGQIEILKASRLHKKKKNKLKCVYDVTHKPNQISFSDQDRTSVKLEIDPARKVKKSKSVEKEKQKVEENKKLERANKIRLKKVSTEKTCEVVKIFERDEVEGVPEIILLPSCNDTTNVNESWAEIKSATIKTNIQTPIEVPISVISVSHIPHQDCAAAFSSTSSNQETIRITNSAPEIFQTCSFSVDNTKV